MKKELLIGCGSNRDKRMRLANDQPRSGVT